MNLIVISLLSLSLLSPPAFAQSSQAKRVTSETVESLAMSTADLLAAQRREFATSTVISLAKEATSFNDLALRPRVLARAADILWDADNVERERSCELLDKAIHETTRIENASIDRAVLLVGIAIQLTTTEPSRMWEIMSQVARAANASEDFNGENSVLYSMPTRGGIKFITIGGENFSLFRLFQVSAKEDLYRSVDLTKSFKHDAPRAASILAIAGAVLSENKQQHKEGSGNAKQLKN